MRTESTIATASMGVGGALGLGSVSSLVESATWATCAGHPQPREAEVGWKLVPRISQDLSQMLTG